MDFKKFRRDYELSQTDLAKILKCGQANISLLESGSRSLTGNQIRSLIDCYGVDVISKYADPEEMPANITINMPKVESNSGQINGGGGNTMSTIDSNLVNALNEALKMNSKTQEQLSKSQEQIDRLISILEKK